MSNNNFSSKTTSRRANIIEELEGYYYQIPEYVYYSIPVGYRVGYKFTLKKLPIICISLLICIGVFRYLSEVSFRTDAVCAMFPILIILFLVILISLLPRDPLVTKDSHIVEAEVKDVEKYRSRYGYVYIAELYIPSADKVIKTSFGQAVSTGRYAVIVRQKNTLTYIKMLENYIPEYISDNQKIASKDK